MAGLFYEEFEIGQIFNHPIRRTITETDNVLLFLSLTLNDEESIIVPILVRVLILFL